MPKFHVLSVSSNAGAVGFHIFGAGINRRQHALKRHLKSALTCEQRNILHRSSKRADIIKIKRADVVEIFGKFRRALRPSVSTSWGRQAASAFHQHQASLAPSTALRLIMYATIHSPAAHSLAR